MITDRADAVGIRATAALSALVIAIAGTASGDNMRTHDQPSGLERYNVVWTTPSEDARGSMPIGNGNVGANLWVEPNGDLVLYLAGTDAWSEDGRLVKHGRARLRFTPPLVAAETEFRQQLDLHNGMVRITAATGRRHVELSVRVDANRPVVCVDGRDSEPSRLRVTLEPWRTARRELEGQERHSVHTIGPRGQKYTVEPDTVLTGQTARLTWCHRNERSLWPAAVEAVDRFADAYAGMADPLLHRTFGGCILGKGLVAADSLNLVSEKPGQTHEVRMFLLTAQTETAAEWLKKLDALVTEADTVTAKAARRSHEEWWHAFWDRSWIFAAGADTGADAVTRGYVLQRWINACGGRGRYPIKFNGSIFTVDAEDQGRWDADYRRWGPCYWFQNTRLAYWPMLAAGDFDMMRPFFRMYGDALPAVTNLVGRHYGHGGAAFAETMPFWGRVTLKYDIAYYGTHYYSQSTELAAMMLDYYALTQDREFVKRSLLPMAEAGLAFYSEHFPRNAAGKLDIHPADSIETYWMCRNPSPDVAGLHYVLARLLALPESLTTPDQRDRWRKFAGELPPVPTRQADVGQVLSPAGEYSEKRNTENPELYAVFPYRLYGAGMPQLELARRTYAIRLHKGSGGWQQDAIHAADLGLAEDARGFVVHNATNAAAGFRFPAMWGPNFDWIPDQCHGGVLMLALQHMLMQCEGRRILLLPAWPKDWDADFKLHAPFQTTVQGRVRSGKVVDLKVDPPERKKDVELML